MRMVRTSSLVASLLSPVFALAERTGQELLQHFSKEHSCLSQHPDQWDKSSPHNSCYSDISGSPCLFRGYNLFLLLFKKHLTLFFHPLSDIALLKEMLILLLFI